MSAKLDVFESIAAVESDPGNLKVVVDDSGMVSVAHRVFGDEMHDGSPNPFGHVASLGGFHPEHNRRPMKYAKLLVLAPKMLAILKGIEESVSDGTAVVRPGSDLHDAVRNLVADANEMGV